MSSKCLWCYPLHCSWPKCCKIFQFSFLELSFYIFIRDFILFKILFLPLSCSSVAFFLIVEGHMIGLHWNLQVHGAFAGYSGITVGICNTHYVYLPIPEVIRSPRFVDPNSRMWHRCLTSTGQPDFCWFFPKQSFINIGYLWES